MLFKINTEMQRRQLTVVEQFAIENPIRSGMSPEDLSNERSTQDGQYVPLRGTHKMIGKTVGEMEVGKHTIGSRYTQTIGSSS